jgi:antitoxin (DNA-binding transcriptional repressor) of toxin-antitoxin stability system
VYNVRMKKYSVSLVRERLSDALDQAERGESVLIERRGVTYRLSVDTPRRSRRSGTPQIEILDKAVEAGAWTWDWRDGALRFRARRR